MKYKMKFATLLCAAMMLSPPVSVYADDNGKFYPEKDSWSFTNSPTSFHSTYKEDLFPEHYEKLKQNLNHVEYRLIQNIPESTEFIGMCYGFAVTSILAAQDIFVPSEHADEFDYYAKQVTEDLSSVNRINQGWYSSKQLYEQSLIAYYMLLQSTDAVRQASVEKCAWTMEQKLDFLVECTEQNHPVLVCYNALQENEYLGHAVVAYGLEKGEWEWSSGTYDTRILIYDPNFPSQEQIEKSAVTEEVKDAMLLFYDKNQLYFNSQNHRWIIPNLNDYSYLDFFCLEDKVSILNDKGLLSGTSYSPPEWTDVISTNALQSDYLVAVTDSGEKLEEYPWFYMDGDEAVRQNFVHRKDEKPYTLQLGKPQNLHSVVYYQNAMLISDSESGTKAEFDPTGVVAVSGENACYSLEMVINEDYPTQWHDVIVSGTAENASLSMRDEGYVLSADHLNDIIITAKNYDNTQEKRYDTEAGSILFYENESGELAAAVDLDSNGTYETVLEESYLLGDVNQDLIVNAKDATAILKAAARIGTGIDTGLITIQEKSADVNSDGILNSSDATWILRYSAAIGSGSFQGGDRRVYCKVSEKKKWWKIINV